MKKGILITFLFLAFLTCFSQVTEEWPVSWDMRLNSEIAPIELPPLDLEAIIVEDSINDLDKSLPWRYGVTRPLQFDFSQVGEWTDIQDVGRIWRVAIKSPDAINLVSTLLIFIYPKGQHFIYTIMIGLIFPKPIQMHRIEQTTK